SGGEKTRVEIMTIHKAKGLEFDRVIVPGAGKKPPNAEKRLLLWMEKGADLLLSPIEEQGPTGDRGALYRYLSKTYSEKELLETARLLYVAATRAKKNLHIFGHAKEDSGTIKTEERSLLYPIRHILRPETLIELPAASPRGVPRGGPSNAREGNGETIGPLLGRKRLPLSWKVEEPLQPVLSDKEKALPAGAIEGPVFDWAGRAVRHLGTVVHGYLSLIAKDGAEKWSPARIDKEKGAISLMLRSLGLNKDEAQRTAPEATRIISNALNDARGRWVLKGRHGASEELKLTGLINGDIVRAAIDRTFVDEEGARWIIDFKTGAHRGGSLEAFLKNEKERYRAQLEAYEALIRAKGETRDIKKALYYPAIPAWIEM
ncbi:MAG: PD-(D/E)XK nuclease family protein, partial [Deltaproteobacteria bacterium]|nr:PD-(D/E)XK nuclease family protein [Deltaproteobacteria bacterium]